MKRLIYIALIALSFTACKKNLQEDVLQTNDASRNDIPVNNDVPTPVPATYRWWSMPTPNVVTSQQPEGLNIVFNVNGRYFCIKGFYHFRELYEMNTTTKVWNLSRDLDIDDESQYLFTYQTKVYFGLMEAAQTIYRNFQSLDVTARGTTSLAAFPGTAVVHPTTFVIGNKGYLIGGLDINNNIINQFWEYNFTTNQWTNKGNSPLGARDGMSAFVVDNKVYLGLGYSRSSFNGINFITYKNDWTLFDPASGSSLGVIKADFPGQRRTDAKGFIINNSIYLGFGKNGSGFFSDFWKYNPASNTWSSQDTWPGTLESYRNIFGTFAIGTKGYLIKGELAEFWAFSNTPIITTQ